MRGDEKLSPACDYLAELARNVAGWREKFLTEATSAGRDMFRARLFVDDKLWDDCADRWELDQVFAMELLKMSVTGVKTQINRTCMTRLERKVQQAWQECFVQHLAKLCDESAS